MAWSAEAAAKADGPVAIVHRPLLMKDSLVAQDLSKQLATQYQTLQDEHNSKSEAFGKREEELMKQKSVLSAEAFEQKAKEFRTNAMEAQRGLNMKKAQIDQAEQEASTEVNKRIAAILDRIVNERGLSLVLESQAVANPGSAVDVTQDVLNSLNKEITTMTLKVGGKQDSKPAAGEKANGKAAGG